MPRLMTALAVQDDAYRETVDLVSRIHVACVELKTFSAQSRQYITDSRVLLKLANKQLRSAHQINT